jgi:molybdate transport system substrate-binding protein
MRKKSVPAAAAKIAALSSALLISTGIRLASAAEIKILSAVALEPAIVAIEPEFEKSSGLKATFVYGTVGAVAGRLQNGEDADVVIVSGPKLDELQKQGKVVAGSRINIAKIGVGVLVGKGAAKPDISSFDALKRSLLAAKSIAYTDPARGGASGIYTARLLERLEIAAEMKPKTKLAAGGGPLLGMIAKGDAEIGFLQISEILSAPSVDLVGPLPAEIQNYTLFAAGIVASSKQADAGKALVAFFSSPEVAGIMKARGFEPVSN